jgi:hypothetical protein
MSYFENLLCGSLRISAPSVFELPFNAEDAEIRRGRRKNRSIQDTTTAIDSFAFHVKLNSDDDTWKTL